MKKLISEFKKHVGYISNLEEYCEGYYIGVSIKNIKIDEVIKQIADDLTEKIVNYKYSDVVGEHPFLECDKSLCEKIGFDNITVCPYVGNIYGGWMVSNYIWRKFDDGEDSLIIDLYDMENNKNKIYIKNLIIKELYNFKRDIQWVLNGEYVEKMEEMENKFNSLIEDLI